MTTFQITYFDTEGNVVEERTMRCGLAVVAEAAARVNMADIPAAARYELSEAA